MTSDPGRGGYIDPACPPDLFRRIAAELQCGIAGKGVFPGDRLPDLVRRHCPHIFAFAEAEGFEAIVDLPENTHEALLEKPMPRLALQIRRKRQ